MKSVPIKPPSLARAFFLFNAAIEASMDPGANVAQADGHEQPYFHDLFSY